MRQVCRCCLSSGGGATWGWGYFASRQPVLGPDPAPPVALGRRRYMMCRPLRSLVLAKISVCVPGCSRCVRFLLGVLNTDLSVNVPAELRPERGPKVAISRRKGEAEVSAAVAFCRGKAPLRSAATCASSPARLLGPAGAVIARLFTPPTDCRHS